MHGSNASRLYHTSSNDVINDGNMPQTQETSVAHESGPETSVDTSTSKDSKDVHHSDGVDNNGDIPQLCSLSHPVMSPPSQHCSVQNVNSTNCLAVANSGQSEYFNDPGIMMRDDQTKKITYTRYCWPPIKIVVPEQSSMTPDHFAQVDNKVCQLYTHFTNHYQFWLEAREDCRKLCLSQEHMFCLERRLHTLEQHLANIHIDIERYVTVYEVQAAAAGNTTAYLSSWQKKNLTAVRHHLSELNKLQRDADPRSQLYAARQQKIDGLLQQESSILSELLVPRLPFDSPGNDTRCLSVLIHSSVAPVKTAFICKKISAINKTIQRSAANLQSNKGATATQERAG